MSGTKPSKLGRSSKGEVNCNPSISAISSQTTGSRKSKMLSMPTSSDRTTATDLTHHHKPTIDKAEIYNALYSLNTGIQQFINSVNYLDQAGLDLPFLNGYRILADEIRSAINFSTTEAMSVIELANYRKLESERSRSLLSAAESPNLATRSVDSEA